MTMDTETTGEKLLAQQLIALAEKATGGEWFAGCWRGQCHLKHKHGNGDCVYDYTRSGPDDEYDARYVSTTLNNSEVIGADDYGPQLDRETAAFIVVAKNHAPAIARAYLALLSSAAPVDHARVEAEREPCPVCNGGDCASANPPVAYCPMRDATDKGVGNG